MKLNGKDVETQTFTGRSAEEANAAMLAGGNGRNLLNADISVAPDGTYTILAMFEKKSTRQQLNEG